MKIVLVPVPTRGAYRRLTGAMRLAEAILLRVQLAATLDLDAAISRERVDGGDADAMQAARSLLVAVAAELAAGIQGRHHDLERREIGQLGMRLNRDTTAVVVDGDGPIGADHDKDAVADAGHGLIDTVVDYLVDELMQAREYPFCRYTCRDACAHAQALKNLDLRGPVLGIVRRLQCRRHV